MAQDIAKVLTPFYQQKNNFCKDCVHCKTLPLQAYDERRIFWCVVWTAEADSDRKHIVSPYEKTCEFFKNKWRR